MSKSSSRAKTPRRKGSSGSGFGVSKLEIGNSIFDAYSRPLVDPKFIVQILRPLHPVI
jgi:hypothetical protein